ncbi:MAG: glycogen debranching protein GlgX [Chloroflexota bacterium]|nr:glycogen debranching protein GlgX [Chloroflexota bacterium]
MSVFTPEPASPSANRAQVWPGAHVPLGAHWDGAGVNVALLSEHATAVELCLFAHPDDPSDTERIALPERTGHIWHGYVPGLAPGQVYGYRVYGPYRPEIGLRFSPAKLLIDPYARAVHGRLDYSGPIYGYDHGASPPGDDSRPSPHDDAPFVPRSVVVDPTFDWGDDRSPAIPWGETVIYETHVKGFSRLLPEVAPELRGAYLGLAHPASLEYLRTLGVTAVELVPVHHWLDERSLVALGLTNYWGYNSIAFFAPEARYAVAGSLGQQVTEFKEMVKALHTAGIEVILDVVYNHTAEFNHLGPTLSLRGIDNPVYYRLAPDDPRLYVDVTGTGNTVNVRNANTLRLVMDSLRYWVQEMHVDGFRFDLAPALAREVFDVDREGSFFDAIHQDPVLAGVKLIAEPWDVGANGYHIGRFPTGWSEWNGKYRDSVRHFWRGDNGWVADMGYRLTGSSDLYKADGRQPFASINFVTAHDGFTLTDLVSYDHKHNLANGDDNRDGTDDNFSANYGHEGPTDDPRIVALRARQRRNMLATLFLSQGTPMLLGGDEIGRTQRGNNNAYCQDTDLSWYDWALDDDDEAMLAYTRLLIRLRAEQPVLCRRRFLHGSRLRAIGARDIVWLRPGGGEMTAADWHDTNLHALGCVLHGNAIEDLGPHGEPICGDTLAILLNAGREAVAFDLTGHADHAPASWQTLIDTMHPPDNGGAVCGPLAPVVVPDRTVLLLRELPVES